MAKHDIENTVLNLSDVQRACMGFLGLIDIKLWINKIKQIQGDKRAQRNRGIQYHKGEAATINRGFESTAHSFVFIKV